jgi:hypothetical protein
MWDRAEVLSAAIGFASKFIGSPKCPCNLGAVLYLAGLSVANKTMLIHTQDSCTYYKLTVIGCSGFHGDCHPDKNY